MSLFCAGIIIMKQSSAVLWYITESIRIIVIFYVGV